MDLLLNIALTLGSIILGLIVGVIFEDPLRQRWNAVTRWNRRRQSRNRSAETSLHGPLRTFKLGPISTSQYIVDGNGEIPFAEDKVHITVSTKELVLPNDLQPIRSEIESEQEAKRESGQHYFWNGPNYAVESFRISRTPEEEDPEVRIGFCYSDYFNFLAAMRALDRPVPDERRTFREKYLGDFQWHRPVPAFSSSFGVNVSVVTSDEKLVIRRRSAVVGSRPNQYTIAANEGLSRIDSSGRTPPSPFSCARRALREELAIDPDSYDDYELLAFTIDLDLHQWGCLGMVQLKDMTFPDLIEHATRGAPDRWEHGDELIGVEFDVESVLHFIIDPERRKSWSPAAVVSLYLVLVRVFGRSAVEFALRRMGIRRRGQWTWG